MARENKTTSLTPRISYRYTSTRCLLDQLDPPQNEQKQEAETAFFTFREVVYRKLSTT